jgi:cell division protein FtsA
MASKQEFAVVIDVGSTKITALAGEKGENGKITILGQALVPSRGVKRGVVLNHEEFAIALKELISKLESQVEERIQRADVSMAGMRITTTVYEGVRHIESGIVSQNDVDYLENEASKTPLESGYRMYHMFLRNYEIGEDSDVTVPVGYEGRKLTARYTIISAPSSYRDSIEKALSRIGIQLGNFVLSPLAIAEAVLTNDEKYLGVVSMDIGGGTTKICSYLNGRLMQMAAIPFGGDVITWDLKDALSILPKKAEQLKIEYGQAMGEFAEDGKFVAISGSEGWEHKEISFKSLAYIIQARLEEIIEGIYLYVEKSGHLVNSSQGTVLTGGTSKFMNLLQLLMFKTTRDARLGFTQVHLTETVDLDKTAFLGALGLLRMALRNSQGVLGNRPEGKSRDKIRKPNSGSKFLSNLGKKVAEQIQMIFEDDNANS